MSYFRSHSREFRFGSWFKGSVVIVVVVWGEESTGFGGRFGRPGGYWGNSSVKLCCSIDRHGPMESSAEAVGAKNAYKSELSRPQVVWWGCSVNYIFQSEVLSTRMKTWSGLFLNLHLRGKYGSESRMCILWDVNMYTLMQNFSPT